MSSSNFPLFFSRTGEERKHSRWQIAEMKKKRRKTTSCKTTPLLLLLLLSCRRVFKTSCLSATKHVKHVQWMKVLKEAKRVFPQIQAAVLHMHPSHILSPLHRRSFYAEEEGWRGGREKLHAGMRRKKMTKPPNFRFLRRRGESRDEIFLPPSSYPLPPIFFSVFRSR